MDPQYRPGGVPPLPGENGAKVPRRSWPSSDLRSRSSTWTWLPWSLGACSLALTVAYAVADSWHGHQSDIDVYLMGGRAVFGDHLYTVRLPQGALPFTYPSFSALLFAPLGVLPLTSIQVLWSLLNVVALFALLFATLNALQLHLTRRSTVQWALMALAPALWLQPVRLTFNLGQINLLLALLILVDLSSELRRGRIHLPRGFLIGLAAAIKLTPLIFIPFLFLTGRARAAWTALATFLGCNIFVALVAPRATWQYWTTYVSAVARIGKATFISDQNLRAFLLRTDHGVVANSVLVTSCFLLGLGGMTLAVIAYRRSSPFLGMLVCAVTGLLVSPITWSHHLVWVVPAIGWLAFGVDRPRFGRVWAGLTAVLFWVAPIWRIPYSGNRDLFASPMDLVLGNSYFIAMAVFLTGVGLILVVRAWNPGADRVTATSG